MEAGKPKTADWDLAQGLWWLALVSPWLVWAWLLSYRWSYDEEYYHGWLVLPLAAYLFWLRLGCAPARPLKASGGLLPLFLGLAGGLGLLLAAVMLEPNPLWTSAAWLAYFAALASSLGLLYRAGAWPLCLHFAWSLVFVATALPYPAFVQTSLVEQLKAGNASLVADLLSLSGLPAVAKGSVIETARGELGVEEACSGLRGLQTSVMAALFLGEVLVLAPGRRLVLFLGSQVLALLANLARTAFLTWAFASGQVTYTPELHDWAGLVELVAALAALLGLALWVEGPKSQTPEGPRLAWTPQRKAPIWLALALSGLALLAPPLWYQEGTLALKGEPRWQLQTQEREGWRRELLDPVAKKLLRNDTEDFFRAERGPAGYDWVVLHLSWQRDPAHRYHAGLHTPEVCLPNAGARFEGRLPPLEYTLAQRLLSFDHFRFATARGTYHVFHLLWDEASGRTLRLAENQAIAFGSDRWRLVRERQRRLALEQLTFFFGPCPSNEEAKALMASQLPRLLGPRGGP